MSAQAVELLSLPDSDFTNSSRHRGSKWRAASRQNGLPEAFLVAAKPLAFRIHGEELVAQRIIRGRRKMSWVPMQRSKTPSSDN
jgi:hypothetical protein